MDQNIFLNKYKTVSVYSTLSFDCHVSYMNNNNLKKFYHLNIKVKITLNQHEHFGKLRHFKHFPRESDLHITNREKKVNLFN